MPEERLAQSFRSARTMRRTGIRGPTASSKSCSRVIFENVPSEPSDNNFRSRSESALEDKAAAAGGFRGWRQRRREKVKAKRESGAALRGPIDEVSEEKWKLAGEFPPPPPRV
jgi:hypothetical protein